MTLSENTNKQHWQNKVITGLLFVALIIITVHVVIYIAFGIALIPFPYECCTTTESVGN
jgi:uncharacterized membrane protein